jgi:succinate-semialdehyde dehydrogenase/glutarate-semialdehyde dehydrogenase
VISFTGSTEVGKLLIAKTAGSIKRLSLELGGNAPFIVFDDADIASAADALMANKFRAGGQTCVCANRVYVQRGAEQKFVDAVVERVRKLKVGNGLAEGTDVGPLISREGFEKVRRHVKDAIAKGAKRLLGSDPPAPKVESGCFYPPTVLTDVTPQTMLSREETFGPVVAVQSFDSEQQAVELANGTQYGLAAYVFSRDAERLRRVTSQLRFGHVGANTGTGPTPEAPFGGMKPIRLRT